jgi:hypothetical protein
MWPIVLQIEPRPAACHAWGPICWADAHPGAAGYLQAFGALLLLILVWYQASAERRRRLEERRAFVGLCEDAVRGAFEVLLPLLTWAQGATPWMVAFQSLAFFWGSPANDTLKRVLETPLPQWPSLSLYTRMRAIQHAVDGISASLNAIIEADGSLKPTGETSHSAQAVTRAFAEFKATANEVARRGFIYRGTEALKSLVMRRAIVREAVRLWRQRQWGGDARRITSKGGPSR